MTAVVTGEYTRIGPAKYNKSFAFLIHRLNWKKVWSYKATRPLGKAVKSANNVGRPNPKIHASRSRVISSRGDRLGSSRTNEWSQLATRELSGRQGSDMAVP